MTPSAPPRPSPAPAAWLLVCLLAAILPAAAQPVPTGGDIQVNVVTTGQQQHPSVAVDPAGNFVVVWASQGQDGASWARSRAGSRRQARMIGRCIALYR